MSVLIKGMKMPKDYIKCPFCLLADGHWKCLADGSFADFGGTCRPPKCPLIEVPTPHGRLIDADELHKAMYHRAFETDGATMWQSGCWVRYRAIEQVQDNQPTIIEAEEGKEDE